MEVVFPVWDWGETGRRWLQNLRTDAAEGGLFWQIDVRECEFSMELKYCFSCQKVNLSYVNLFFMARVERKRSLSWMFTKCLQAIFAQVFVTVVEVNEASYEMWCPVIFMKKAMCMCCNICIEINYVHVAPHVLSLPCPLWSLNSTTVSGRSQLNIKNMTDKLGHLSASDTTVKHVSVWVNQSSASNPEWLMDRGEIWILWKCLHPPFETA